MNTPGTNPLIVVGDTDGLIALLSEEDANHKKAVVTITKLLQLEAQTVFPVTAVAETITTLKRKLNEPELAAALIAQITSGELAIEDVDKEMLSNALTIFDPKESKKNTLFDALVVTTARKLNTKFIFSTDDWYTKLGLKLASSLI